MTTLVIATRNAHKTAEIRAILPGSFNLQTLLDFAGMPNTKEDAATFAGNAAKKSVELARWLASGNARSVLPEGESVFVMADDSGLEVDALHGAPGVYSARFAALETGAEGNSPDADNNTKLLRLMQDVPMEKRTARFRCALALTPVTIASESNASPVCDADELELQTEMFYGACEGRIDFALHGAGGFGYDPLFIPDGYSESFGQLSAEVKNRISHRSKALAKLREWWMRQPISG